MFYILRLFGCNKIENDRHCLLWRVTPSGDVIMITLASNLM